MTQEDKKSFCSLLSSECRVMVKVIYPKYNKTQINLGCFLFLGRSINCNVLLRSVLFGANEIHFVCQNKRCVFIVLRIYEFGDSGIDLRLDW